MLTSIIPLGASEEDLWRLTKFHALQISSMKNGNKSVYTYVKCPVLCMVASLSVLPGKQEADKEGGVSLGSCVALVIEGLG